MALDSQRDKNRDKNLSRLLEKHFFFLKIFSIEIFTEDEKEDYYRSFIEKRLFRKAG